MVQKRNNSGKWRTDSPNCNIGSGRTINGSVFPNCSMVWFGSLFFLSQTMNSPSCVLYFCLSSFCSCWKFVLSLIYASVGYGLSTVLGVLFLWRGGLRIIFGVFWVCCCHFSLGATWRARRQTQMEKKTVIQGICIHHSFRSGFHLLEDGR
jgi:hypothetical protein